MRNREIDGETERERERERPIETSNNKKVAQLFPKLIFFSGRYFCFLVAKLTRDIFETKGDSECNYLNWKHPFCVQLKNINVFSIMNRFIPVLPSGDTAKSFFYLLSHLKLHAAVLE